MKTTENKLQPLKNSKLALASAIAVASTMSGQVNAAALEEIYITAQKQDQRIMEIPISVSAVTGEKISDAGINNLADMSSYVPGLHIGKGPINTTINIRGIGSGMNRGFEQSVGMYIDGIYMGRSRQFRSPFLDPQRVEVLRGPQGILFGKNTIAGAVNIISADPIVEGDTEGSLLLKIEENNTYEVTGVYSTSLTDQVAARLAIKKRESDGYVDNITLKDDEPETDETSMRLTLLWEPSDNFSVNTKISYSDYTTEGSTAVPTEFTPIPGNPSALAGAVYGLVGAIQPDFSTDGSHDTFRDDSSTWTSVNGASAWGAGPEGTDTQATTAAVTAVYEFDSGWAVHSVTGYSGYEMDDTTDSDFLPIRFLLTNDDQDFDQVSQELRFTYLEGGPFEFIGGLYYEEQELESVSGAIIDSTFGGLIPGGVFAGLIAGGPLAPYAPLSPEIVARHNTFEQDADTLAVFGEVTWYYRDDLRFTLGGRYSKEGKDVDKTVFVSDSLTGLGTPADVSGGCNFLNPATVTTGCLTHVIMSSSFGTTPHDLSVKGGDEEFFDPSFKVQYDIDYDTMVYYSYSEGHKSGGFNAAADVTIVNYTTPDASFTYDEETAKSHEVGYKGILANGSVQFGISAFMTEYSDLQVASFQGTTFAVGNAAQADLLGVEVEMRWAVLDSLEVGGSFAYLDFEFDDYATAGCTAPQTVAHQLAGTPGSCQQDLSGERNAFAPEYSGNIFADYSQTVFGTLELKATVDLNYKSEMHLDYDLDENTKQSGFGKINARIALADDNWEVAVYGRNLTDKTTHSFSLDTPLAGGAYTGWVDEGKTFGAEAKYMF